MAEIDWLALVPMGLVAAVHTVVVVAALLGAAKTCSGVGLRCGRATSAQEAEDDVDRERSLLAQRLAEIRASYFQELLHVWLHLCGLYAFQYVANRLMGQPPVRDCVWSLMMASGYILGSALRFFPFLLNQRTLWVLHSWNMGLFMAYGVHVAITDASLFVYSNTQFQLGRVLLALGYPEALPNSVWNAAWAVLTIYATLQADAARLGIAGSNVIVWEVAIVFGVSFVMHKTEQLQVLQVRSELEATGHLRAKETVQNVLSDMCDAVVELNRHLDIRRPCAKLAGLLIKPNNITQMRGEAFPGLIFDDTDRERFSEFLLPREVPVEQDINIDGNGGTSSVYVRLRDATGAPVSVQLFHSCHRNPPNDICHIIGVREIQETANLEAFGQEGVVDVAQPDHENVDDETASVASSDTSSTTTTAYGTRMLAPVIPNHKAIDPVSAIVNPITLEIIACTMGFKSYTGPLIFKGSARDIVLNISDFEPWLQEEFNKRFDNSRPKKLELKLVPAMVRKQPHFEFRANAYVLDAKMDVRASAMGVETVGAGAGDQQEEEHDMLCVLALHDVEAHWLRPRRSRSFLNTSRRPRRDTGHPHRNEGRDEAAEPNPPSVAL